MLADPVACAIERAGCAIARITNRAAASALLTLPILLIFHPIRFMLLFLLAHRCGHNSHLHNSRLLQNLMLNAAFTRPHTVWDQPLRPREMPAVEGRSSRRRRRLRSPRNRMT